MSLQMLVPLVFKGWVETNPNTINLEASINQYTSKTSKICPKLAEKCQKSSMKKLSKYEQKLQKNEGIMHFKLKLRINVIIN